MSGIPSWCRVGQKVVCVDRMARPGRTLFNSPPPLRETVVIAGHTVNDTGEQTLIISGYPNPSAIEGRDFGWRIARFRPAVSPRSPEQDIAEHFSHHLNQPAPKRSKVVAAGVRVPDHGDINS